MRDLIFRRPLHDFAGWQRNMDGVFDRFFSEGATDKPAVNWLPRLEAYAKDGQYLIRLDLPGVDPKDVEVSAEDGILTVKGERRHAGEGEKEGYRYRETSYGKFQRSITLPKGIDSEKITARYENGVIEISVPVPHQLAARKVPIAVEAKKNDEARAA